jgi:hypothetical protein
LDEGFLLIDCLPKDQTINAGYYEFLLVQLKDILKENTHSALSSKRVLFLARQSTCSPDTYNPEETGLPGFSVS